MSVSFGCLLRSSLSCRSLGSKAILCPFCPPVYEVSGACEGPFFGVGVPFRLVSFVSSAPPPAPRRRVRPPPGSIGDTRCSNQRVSLRGSGGEQISDTRIFIERMRVGGSASSTASETASAQSFP